MWRELSRTAKGLLILVFLLGALLRLLPLFYGLDDFRYRPDPNFIINPAMGFFQGDFAPQIYYYPHLTNHLTAAAYALYYGIGCLAGAFGSPAEFYEFFQGHENLAPFLLIARGIVLLAAVLMIPTVFWAAHRYYGRGAAMAAVVLTALSYLLVRESPFAKHHLLDVLSTIFFLGSLVSVLEKKGERPLLVSGLLWGICFSFNFSSLILLVPFGLAHLLSLKKEARSSLRPHAHFMVSLALGAVFFVVVNYAFLVNYADLGEKLFGNYARFLTSVRYSYEAWPYGYLHEKMSYLYTIFFSLRYGMGLPFLLVSAGGLAWAVARHSKRDLVLITSFLVAYLIVGHTRTSPTRYVLLFLPPLILIASGFLASAVERLSLSETRRGVLLVLLAVVVMLPSLKDCVEFDRIALQDDTRELAVEWIRENIPEGSTLAVNLLPDVANPPFERYDRADSQVVWNELRIVSWRSLEDGTVDSAGPEYALSFTARNYSLPIITTYQTGYQAYLAENFTPVMTIDPYRNNAEGGPLLYDEFEPLWIPYVGLERIERAGPLLIIWKRNRLEN